MFSEPEDEAYFKWLYKRTGAYSSGSKTRTHWNLMRQLFTKEFVWIIPNDDNRVEDAKDLRFRFLEDRGVYELDPDWLMLGSSMLEIILSLADRMTFEADRTPREWFWEILNNIGIDSYTDDTSAFAIIDDACDRVIWRTYEPDGNGGFFPLKDPAEDQRDVEIWYQLCAYLLERD